MKQGNTNHPFPIQTMHVFFRFYKIKSEGFFITHGYLEFNVLLLFGH